MKKCEARAEIIFNQFTSNASCQASHVSREAFKCGFRAIMAYGSVKLYSADIHRLNTCKNKYIKGTFLFCNTPFSRHKRNWKHFKNIHFWCQNVPMQSKMTGFVGWDDLKQILPSITPPPTPSSIHPDVGYNMVARFFLLLFLCVVWHQEEGGEGSRGSSCYGAGLRGQPHPSEEGGAHRLRRRGGRGEHRGYGHEIHPDPAHGYVQ